MRILSYSVGLLKSQNTFTATKVIIVFIHKIFQLHPMCFLFFQMFRQNTLLYFIYFEGYLMIFEFWCFVLVLTQCSKMLIGLYLDKYFIFHNDFQISNIDTKLAIFHKQRSFEGWSFILHLTSNVNMSLQPKTPSCCITFRSPFDLFMVTIGQGIIQVLSLISRSFLI